MQSNMIAGGTTTTCAIQKNKDHGCFNKGDDMIIKIVQEQHFIEGDRYFAYIETNIELILIASNVKSDGYLDMCEKLDGLKFRLEQLGNTVEIKTEFRADPNFDTAAEAEEYLNNKD